MQIYTDDNTGAGRIVSDQSYLTLGTSLGGTSLSLDTRNNVNATANIIPTATATYDLGSPTNYWNNGYITTAYIGGNLHVGGNSIVLGNSTSDSLTINSAIKSNLIPDKNITYDLGSTSYYWNNAYVGNLVANNISAASTTIGGTQSKFHARFKQCKRRRRYAVAYLLPRHGPLPNVVFSWNASAAAKRFELNQPLFYPERKRFHDGDHIRSRRRRRPDRAANRLAGFFRQLGRGYVGGRCAHRRVRLVHHLPEHAARGRQLPRPGNHPGIAQATSSIFISSTGQVGIGTTTPQWSLNPTSATAPQLSLSAGAGLSQWVFGNEGGNLYVAPTTVAGTATTSTTALTVLNNGNVGMGTTNPGGHSVICGGAWGAVMP